MSPPEMVIALNPFIAQINEPLRARFDVQLLPVNKAYPSFQEQQTPPDRAKFSIKEEDQTYMKPFIDEKNTPPVSAQFFLNIDFEIETQLKFSSENIIEPLPSEKLSSNDEFIIIRREFADM